jgi:hypothetical protein
LRGKKRSKGGGLVEGGRRREGRSSLALSTSFTTVELSLVYDIYITYDLIKTGGI